MSDSKRYALTEARAWNAMGDLNPDDVTDLARRGAQARSVILRCSAARRFARAGARSLSHAGQQEDQGDKKIKVICAEGRKREDLQRAGIGSGTIPLFASVPKRY